MEEHEVDYRRTVRGIRNILLQEDRENLRALISSHAIFNSDFIQFMGDLAKNKLETCVSYADLENYIGESRRMSLTDWIQSL